MDHIKTIEFSFLTDEEKLSIAAREISCSNINDKSGYYNCDGPMSYYLGSSSSFISAKRVINQRDVLVILAS